MTLLANRAATSSNVHAFRHALERRRVPEDIYLADYYGRWMASADMLLQESGLLAPGAVEAPAGEAAVGGRTPRNRRIPKPNKPTMETAGGGNLRTVDAAARVRRRGLGADPR